MMNKEIQKLLEDYKTQTDELSKTNKILVAKCLAVIRRMNESSKSLQVYGDDSFLNTGKCQLLPDYSVNVYVNHNQFYKNYESVVTVVWNPYGNGDDEEWLEIPLDFLLDDEELDEFVNVCKEDAEVKEQLKKDLEDDEYAEYVRLKEIYGD